MANAMLEDDFKSSHPDLAMMNEEAEQRSRQQQHHAHRQGGESQQKLLLPSSSSALIMMMGGDSGNDDNASYSNIATSKGGRGSMSSSNASSPSRQHKKSVDFTFDNYVGFGSNDPDNNPGPSKRARMLEPQWTPKQVVDGTCPHLGEETHISLSNLRNQSLFTDTTRGCFLCLFLLFIMMNSRIDVCGATRTLGSYREG